jgi:branched-subunit amino acid aminotransferase/4-amino-4-deoxychorismate lyase
VTWTYLNGAFFLETEALVPATDSGLLHANGLFETFRARRGHVYRLTNHVARLRSGAGVLGITPPEDLDHLPEIVREITSRAHLTDARLRLTLTAGPPDGMPAFIVQARLATDYPAEMYARGATAVISPVRRNETSPLSRIKSLNYLDNLLARRDAQRVGALDALLLNTRGTLAEGAASNVFIVRRGAVLTPPVEDGALPGITRAAVLDLARSDRINTEEASFPKEDLFGANEAYLTNAVMGVMPLVSVDGAAIGSGKPGAVTERIRMLYEAAAAP